MSGSELGLLAASTVLLPAMAVALRLVGFARLRAATSTPPVQRESAQADREAARVRATARMVAAAGHYGPYRATCLPQSLVLQWLLRRQGIATRLQLGVRKDEGVLAAHAWVEYCGQPLIDSPEVHDRFAAFAAAEPARNPAPRGAP